WLPVHPWQYAHLRRRHPALLDACIDLGEGPGAGMPTASLRSLGVAHDASLHLKLSLGVQALGAERVMPPRYLRNGALAQACLAALRERDAWLAAHLQVCDERAWWALGAAPASGDAAAWIAERGDLACLLRRYPRGEGWLLPMAALGVSDARGRLPAFDALCGGAAASTPARRRGLFAQLARLLAELGLRCFRHGVMPELHGQNVVLRVGADGLTGLVLRDHDTLRICPPLMAEAGVAAPDYLIDRSTPNTLILEAPGALFAYFQTLAVGVNLYAIAAALSEADGEDEALAWQWIGDALRDAVAGVFGDGAAPALRELAEAALFDSASWPFKQLIEPLVGRVSIGTGMPSGLGEIANPLRAARAGQGGRR
ncbi:IucA/IucC family protein, partial [Burkholderia sp. Cy-637]|uniref:IucA/IucC family protein n=4 Tax=unclassified Burkholderia TaxID=2613784 RepID=UPI0023D9BC9F